MLSKQINLLQQGVQGFPSPAGNEQFKMGRASCNGLGCLSTLRTPKPLQPCGRWAQGSPPDLFVEVGFIPPPLLSAQRSLFPDRRMRPVWSTALLWFPGGNCHVLWHCHPQEGVPQPWQVYLSQKCEILADELLCREA